MENTDSETTDRKSPLGFYISIKKPDEITSSISNSVESHAMAFAAEEARLHNKCIDLTEFYKKNSKQ